MSQDCLFCKIIEGNIPSEKVFENQKVYAFKDVSPLAKEHYLFIHKEHTKNINEIAQDKPYQLADVFSAIADFTQNKGLTEQGFRVVTNLGSDAGQSVFHSHFHVLGGEKLKGFGS